MTLTAKACEKKQDLQRASCNVLDAHMGSAMGESGEHYAALSQDCVNLDLCERAENQANRTLSEQTFASRQLTTGR